MTWRPPSDRMRRVISPERLSGPYDLEDGGSLHVPQWTCKAPGEAPFYTICRAPDLRAAVALFERTLGPRRADSRRRVVLDPYRKIERSPQVFVGYAEDRGEELWSCHAVACGSEARLRHVCLAGCHLSACLCFGAAASWLRTRIAYADERTTGRLLLTPQLAEASRRLLLARPKVG